VDRGGEQGDEVSTEEKNEGGTSVDSADNSERGTGKS